ncbi:MAG: hypothetical protein ACRDI3_06060 [Actinomycetota bacterium]
MQVTPRRPDGARRTPAPIVQAGLALLVAGTLVTFSFLAFRTGFADQPRGTVAAAERGHTDRRPVLLPSPGRITDRDRGESTPDDEATAVAAVETEEDERVLGTRFGRVHDVWGTGYDTRTDLDDRSFKRSGASVSDDEAEVHGKPAKEKHAKSHAKVKKGARALGHQKHGHPKNGRGHTKHDH